jgi:hypothetical protein
MSAAVLLERLDGVRQTAPSRWLAKCPAHQDKSPSLSVREVDDGRVLMHCFGGCGAIDVLDALGLNWSALFPEGGHQTAAPAQSRIPAGDLLKVIREESLVVGIIAFDILSTRTISEPDWKRLSVAVGRIGTVADYASR